jgi:hypothetical protein
MLIRRRTRENQHIGGRGGIRTHGALAGTPVFKTGALNHSATLPDQEFQSLTVAADRTQCERGSKLNRTAFFPGKVSHERAAAAQEFARTPTSQSLQPDTKITSAKLAVLGSEHWDFLTFSGRTRIFGRWL